MPNEKFTIFQEFANVVKDLFIKYIDGESLNFFSVNRNENIQEQQQEQQQQQEQEQQQEKRMQQITEKIINLPDDIERLSEFTIDKQLNIYVDGTLIINSILYDKKLYSGVLDNKLESLLVHDKQNNILMMLNYKLFSKFLSVCFDTENQENITNFYERFSIISLSNSNVFNKSSNFFDTNDLIHKCIMITILIKQQIVNNNFIDDTYFYTKHFNTISSRLQSYKIYECIPSIQQFGSSFTQKSIDSDNSKQMFLKYMKYKMKYMNLKSKK
jgi:hypothetical protein